jgi:hypothetical protein
MSTPIKGKITPHSKIPLFSPRPKSIPKGSPIKNTQRQITRVKSNPNQMTEETCESLLSQKTKLVHQKEVVQSSGYGKRKICKMVQKVPVESQNLLPKSPLKASPANDDRIFKEAPPKIVDFFGRPVYASSKNVFLAMEPKDSSKK